MKIRVVDLETTGLPDDAVKAICEVGWTDLHGDWSVQGPTSHLVNPGHPIPPATRAVHHISDEDVGDAISPDMACRRLMEGMEPGDMFAAHNAQFERAFFGGGSFPWICTFKCSKHLFPDAPAHGNQVLRYWLDIDHDGDFRLDAAMPPHRAGPDTFVTALILRRLVLTSSAEKLVELTTAPVLLQTITFGKHRGTKWAELPRDYLQWIAHKSDLGADEKHTARHHLGAAA